jgi:amino acid transporter
MNTAADRNAGGAGARDAGLVRALGLREMTFNTVNLVVGASIFVLPATVAGVLGPAAVIAYVVCAIAMAFIALCFAEAGSRVASTGGLYAYAEAAFGPFAGYLAGVVMWFGSFMLGNAGIAVVLAGSIGALFPPLASRPWQVALLVALFAGLALANVRGTQIGARVVVALTVLKLAPLLLLIGVGLFFIEPAQLAWPGVPDPSTIADGALVLVFAFMGLEMAVTPGGEIRDPARTVPRAILSALALVTLLYSAVQLVAQGVLGPGLAAKTTAPLAAVAETTLGGGGRAIILVGTILSTFGYLAGDMLTSPRVLFAFGRDGHLPRVFGRVHPRFHTPHVAIVVHAAAALGFALSGTFQSLVVLSVVSTLLIYLVCAAAVLVMRQRGIRTAAPPFVAPGGPLVPILACGVVIWLLSRATRAEFIAVGVMLAVAVVLYVLRRLAAPKPSMGSAAA